MSNEVNLTLVFTFCSIVVLINYKPTSAESYHLLVVVGPNVLVASLHVFTNLGNGLVLGDLWTDRQFHVHFGVDLNVDALVVFGDLAGAQDDLSTDLTGIDFIGNTEREVPILIFPTVRILHVDEVSW